MNDTVLKIYTHLLVYKGKMVDRSWSVFGGTHYILEDDVKALALHVLVTNDYIAGGIKCQ